MSCNIISIDILASEGLSITRPRLEALRVDHGQEAAECSIFDAQWPGRCCEEHRGVLFVNAIWWTSECSGHSYDRFLECLKGFAGSADLIVTWQGGDRTGLRLVNGVVTQHKVVLALGEEVAGG